MKGCNIEDFKTALDSFLEEIPDEPNIPGTHYTPRAMDIFTAKPSNSLLDQVRHFNIDNPPEERTRFCGQ